MGDIKHSCGDMVTLGEHAEGVIDLSPGWSEAEPWVLNISMGPL